MFPFYLSGPQFLAMYVLLSVVLLFAYWFFARPGGEGPATSPLGDLTADPYRISYLRGSDDETLRLAVVNLIDRGLLANEGNVLSKGANAAEETLRRALDRAILKRCERPTSYADLQADRGVIAACKLYESELANAGFLRSEPQQGRALVGLLVVLAILGGLALLRVVQAVSQGRFNVLFLVALAALACWIAGRIYSERKTSAGMSKLKSLETLMARLKARAGSIPAGGATNEALLLAAVFGLAALPGTAFPFIDQLFPKPQPTSSSSCSSGSSCGSSSSCGGGGSSGCGGCGGGGD